MPLSEVAEKEIAEQLNRLEKRVEQSGLYIHEPAELQVAIVAYRAIFERLGIQEDCGSLTTQESRNLVRLVRLRNGRQAVAKIIGNTVEPGEGPVLDAWVHAGLPAVHPIDHGYQPVDTNQGVQVAMFVLTDFLPGPTLEDLAPTTPKTDAQAQQALERKKLITRALVHFIRPFHERDVRVIGVPPRRWYDRLEQHLKWTLPQLQACGLEPPREWEQKMCRVSETGFTVLHGDAAKRNILIQTQSTLYQSLDEKLINPNNFIAIDPPGFLIGRPELDIGQICSQVGGVVHVGDLVDVAFKENRRLDQGVIAATAGLNFVIWSGYFLANHQNPDVWSGDIEQRVKDAQHYLRVAEELLSEFRVNRLMPVGFSVGQAL